MLANSTTSKKTFMLIPAMPTPNGRLHLGHIGGPFLAVDVLARHLRTAGHDTIVLSGTDSYDSYITGQAVKENKTPDQICNQYHDQIESDLMAMQIGFDKFVNPLSAEWSQTYFNWLQLMLEQLEAVGVTQTVQEMVGIDEKTGRFITGCWLPGFCPSCSAVVCGYFCEDCGSHFRPEEVVGAPETSIKRQVKNIFMELPASSNLDGRGIHQSIREVYSKFVDVQKGLLRLTANSEWGLKISDQEKGDRFFNYPFAYAYALMLGEIAGKLSGLDINALSSSSEIVTVAAFGIDNTIPVLGSIEGITASLKQYKQFDYYLVNHFLDLDGSKFSTSRRHAIWVDDAINQLGASSDIIRLYLATINIRTGTGNVSGQDLLKFYNNTIQWIENMVVAGVEDLADVINIADSEHNHQAGKSVSLDAPIDEALLETLATLLVKQQDALNPENYRLFDAVVAINEWLEFGTALNRKSQNYFWWLKGLVLLVYPFMPRLGETLWITLGFSGEPRIANFTAAPELAVQRHLPTNLRRLTKADIDNVCMRPAYGLPGSAGILPAS